MTFFNPLNFRIAAITLMIIQCLGCRHLAPEQRPAPQDYRRTLATPLPQAPPRKLCIFMDGTKNDFSSQTNVRKLYELISLTSDPATICYYDTGVGAEEHSLSGPIGGSGFTKNVAQGWTFLSENYRKGDKIYMFGFSRGARQIQVLCDLIDNYGIPKPYGAKSDEIYANARELIREYKSFRQKALAKGQIPVWPHAEKEKTFERVDIEFVGIWDCVESLGNNAWRMLWRRELYNGDYQDHFAYNYSFPKCITRAYHAMALDEARGLYEVVKWRIPLGGIKGQHLEQVWFAGSHGDVGGGYPASQSLSGVSFNWILSKLENDELLPTSNFRIYDSPAANAVDSGKFKLAGALLERLRKSDTRMEHFWNDKVYSLVNGKYEYTLEPIEKPLIHDSVIARIKEDSVILTNGKYDKKTNITGPYTPRIFELDRCDETLRHPLDAKQLIERLEQECQTTH